METISSRQNPRVRALKTLLREKDARAESGRFAVEGLRECERALAAGVRPDAFYLAPELFRDADAPTRLARAAEAAGARGFELSRAAFESLSLREGPDGVLITAPLRATALEGLPAPKKNGLFLVLESVEKPGNLGALLRTADAAGVDAVLCCGHSVDLHNPNVIRNSQGAVFSVPVAYADNAAVARFLEKAGASLVLTTPAVEPLYWDADMRQPCALLLGSEKDGLSEFWLSRAGNPVRIPMAGGADSLNVGVAAALVLFEAARQRR